ncbi:transcriptional regulator, putative [Babesia ovata]|uniref:Transcriptional regulator, putative n=1 Tax=Babesia ovata TaxID=189622 RepID=A0A2H6KAI8_9APIC|nr:transcriptional regulator, putative [Babesia ovata]GBE60017.1 transcriptional regulator, putative [Babesia ovata]
MNETAANAPLDLVVRAFQQQHRVQLLADRRQHRPQTFGLTLSARESVQNKTATALKRIYLAFNQLYHDLVGNQHALIHEFLGLETHGVAAADSGTQDVAGRQVAVAVGVTESQRLSALQILSVHTEADNSNAQRINGRRGDARPEVARTRNKTERITNLARAWSSHEDEVTFRLAQAVVAAPDLLEQSLRIVSAEAAHRGKTNGHDG